MSKILELLEHLESLESGELKRAVNGQYSHKVIAYDPKVRGFAICTRNEECETCPYALAHLNPEIPLYIFTKGDE
ncbi:MAG: hypothetical protein WCS17_10280 [Prevotella sp.]